jgi:hypothetical protein
MHARECGPVSSIEPKIINAFRKMKRVVKLSTGIIGLECPIKVHGETQYILKGHNKGNTRSKLINTSRNCVIPVVCVCVCVCVCVRERERERENFGKCG